MYESPINVVVTDMATKMENEVLSVVQSYGIIVDKDELVKALQYDRDQYQKGYEDGKRVRYSCLNCKHQGEWDNEREYGYWSPCTKCIRSAQDYFEPMEQKTT